MKRRLISLLLMVALLISVFPIDALAWTTAVDIELKDAKYYSDGSLYSITAKFDWGTAGRVSNAYLLLMTEPLSGSNPTDGTGLGDFSDFGDIEDLGFNKPSDAIARDVTTGQFGILKVSEKFSVAQSNNTIVFAGLENCIPLDSSIDTLYYIYLWVTVSGSFYPDNLIGVIRVNNGKPEYSPAIDSETYRNHFNSNAFSTVAASTETGVDVAITAGANMTHVTASGATRQTGLTSSMVEVVYQANPGYYFADTYTVAPVNNVTVTRSADGSTITVSGTPSDHTAITLPDLINKTHTHTPGYKYTDENGHWTECTDTSCTAADKGKTPLAPHSFDNDQDTTCICGYTRVIQPEHNHTTRYTWDNTQHWQVTLCNVDGCADSGKKINIATHKFDGPQDTTCDCGYIRTAPAEKPETGDITNIPLWTALFLGGMALLWVQLEQRKRQQF